MGWREALTHLCAMKVWAQQVPEEFREEGIKMWQSKVKANKKPATITLERKRNDFADDISDGVEDQDEKESSGGKSGSKGDTISRRPTRGRTTHATTVVTSLARVRQTGEKSTSVGTALKAVTKEQ